MAGLLTPPTTPYKSQKQKRRAPLTTVDLNFPLLSKSHSHHDVPFSFSKHEQPIFNKPQTEQREPSPAQWEAAWLGEPSFLVPEHRDREKSCNEPSEEAIVLRETRAARPVTPPPEPRQATMKHEAAKEPRVEYPEKTPGKRVQAKKRKALSWRATQQLIFLDDDYATTVSAQRTIKERSIRDEPRAKVSSKAAPAPVQKKKEPLFLPWDSEDERCQRNTFWEQYEPLWPSDDDSEDDAALRQSMQNEPMVLDIAHERPADPRPKREPPPKYVPKPFSTCGVEVGMRAADKNVDSPLESINTAEETRGSQAPARRQVQPHSKADIVMKDARSSSNKLKRGAVRDAESDGRGATKRRRVEIEPAMPTQARHTHREVDLTRTATSKTASKATKKAPAAARNVRGSNYGKDMMGGGPSIRHPWLSVARKFGIVSPFY